MKFICDQMFNRLGKWLRAAGYDTVIIHASTPDALILERAQQEHRFLVTRDQHFLQRHADPKVVIYLKCNTTDECAKELSQRLPMDWLKQPFSRCLLCNHPFVAVSKADVNVQQLPPDILQHFDAFWKCEQCQKIFWQGSHAKRMLSTLKKWQNI